MKKLSFAFAFLLFALPASAQLTSVSGTVRDSNGVVYASAQIKMQIVTTAGSPVSGQPTMTVNNQAQCVSGGFGSAPCQVPFQGTVGPFQISPTGTFTINLQDNTQVTPAATQWLFTINSTGAPPPLGTGPQVCSSQITISGASQSVSTNLSACPPLGAAGGNGGGAFDNTVNPLQPTFGAKWDVKFVYDAATTNGSGTITCPQGDCTFTSADVGKIIFAFQGPFDANSGTGSYATLVGGGNTIGTVNSANSITLAASATAVATCTPTPGDNFTCALAWGSQDDTPAIISAQNAAWTVAGKCGALQLPSGNAFVNSQFFNVQIGSLSSACGGQTGTISGGADLTQTGPEVYGQGPGNTQLIPLPTFNFAGCTFGSGNACIGTTPALEAHDFSINGLNQSTGGGGPTLWEFNGSTGGFACTGSTGYNLSFANWQVSGTGTGITFARNACASPYYSNIVVELFGSNTCNVNASINVDLYAVVCFGSTAHAFTANTNAHIANSPAIINTYGSAFGQTFASGSLVQVTGSGVWNSYGDFLFEDFAPGGGSNLVNTGCTSCKVNFYGTTLEMNAQAATSQVFVDISNTAAQIHLKNSNVLGSGSNIRIYDHIAGTLAIFDDGGNSWFPGATASNFAVGGFTLVGDGHSVKGICTGVGTATSTLTERISGTSVTGAGIPTTCTSTTLDAGFPVQGVRTLFGFYATATAAGTNASSGAVTVLKNGVGTAITCTIGTGTFCGDFTHTVAVADGDLISIQFTTQAADTLAGVKSTIVWN